jgi:predicted DNA-binding WGR domain protein
METLVRVDSKKHMYRWYSVGIQTSLVDDIAVVIGWGSLKSTYQSWRVRKVASLEDAQDLVERLIQAKVNRGYQQKRGNER